MSTLTECDFKDSCMTPTIQHDFGSYNIQRQDFELIILSIYWASIWHKDQRRKDNAKTPYINHPIEAMMFLVKNGVVDRDTLIAVILHDVIEDTTGKYNDIKKEFGQIVADYVNECTDDKKLNKIQRKKNQIIHAKTISDAAKLVKLADKYSNLLGLLENPPKSWKKEEITGCVYWCFAVCKNLFGVNSKIDDIVKDLFKKHGVDLDMSDEKLEEHLANYYKVIDKST